MVTDKEKLTQKFLNDKLRITIQDCDRLLTIYGYALHKGGGSHRVYHKKGAISITIVAPKKSKFVIAPYINKLIMDLGLEKK